jgi:glycosyltransferase involved in cell wall biosynthesis
VRKNGSSHPGYIRLVPVWIRRLVPTRIKSLLRSFSPHGDAYRSPVLDEPVPDVWDPVNSSAGPSRRALLSYITAPFRATGDAAQRVRFSNMGIARSIVAVLNALGYIVDVVEYTDTSFTPENDYDLFIGHGGANFVHIAAGLRPGTRKVYFSTSLYWMDFNRREQERFDQLARRRGVRLPFDRWITESEEEANECADAIICLGNQFAKESYAKFPHVFNLNNAAYHDDRYELAMKDFDRGRDGFLFFAGDGNVHKGLDLLLEAFGGLPAELYVCQLISPRFHEVYRHELEDLANIHVMGWVPMRTPTFYDLIARCNFAIFPSCAEGSQGSAIECMHQGLIPVVSRESTIDTDDYGITLRRCSVDEIARVVRELTEYSPERCERMSRLARKAAVTKYSEEAFMRGFEEALRRVTADGGGDRSS